MFCPKCSQPQPSEDLRFCPRCGFPVGAVRDLVSREGARDEEDGRAAEGPRLPAQKDISTGALLMFAGGVAALLWGFMGPRFPPEIYLPQAYFILGLALVFLLTLFHPLLGALEKLFSGGAAPHTPRRRDGINLGALLMFAGTLKAMLITSFMPHNPERGTTAILFMAGTLLLLLLLRPLLRVAHALFFKSGERAGAPASGTTASLGGAPSPDALPPAHSIPVNGFAAAVADTGEIIAPPSVTEETTRKLNNF